MWTFERDEVQFIYYTIGGVGQMLTHCDRGGGGGVHKGLKYYYVINEQPLFGGIEKDKLSGKAPLLK